MIGALAYVGIHNSIIGEGNRCEEAWSGIDMQLRVATQRHSAASGAGSL